MRSSTLAAPSGEWVPDLSTENSEMRLQQESLRDYLTSLRLYDPVRRQVNWTGDVAVTVQRARIDTQGNVIKEKMLETVLRGGILPAKALCERGDGRRSLLDGLQRTDVEAQAVQYLLHRENDEGEKIPPFAQGIMKQIGDEHLRSAEELLDRPVSVQIWRGLSEPEEVRMFMVLNLGQQKVSQRHLLEALTKPLNRLFRTWGLGTATEKEEEENGKQRAKWKADDLRLPPFRQEYLVNAVMAYIDQDWQIKTKGKLQEVYKDQSSIARIGPALIKRLMDLGDVTSRSDFLWACKDMNEEIARVYRTNSRWRVGIQESDNFFFPMMAALGKAREDHSAAQVEERKADILNLLREATEDSDPLQFSSPEDRCLDSVRKEIGSNIGRNQRTLVYRAWREYFRVGRAQHLIYIDWREAYKTL